MRRITLFYLFILGASSILFSSFFSSSTFALSDLSFSDCSVSPYCSLQLSPNRYDLYQTGYHYLLITSSSPSPVTSYTSSINFNLCASVDSCTTSYNFSIPAYFSSAFLALPEGFYNRISVNRNSSFTFVFTDSNPFSSSSGSITLTQNGTFDVSSYAQAVVDVPPVYGDYHDDLISINNSILICGAVLLVLYFFYTIYRMIIKSTGGWS